MRAAKFLSNRLFRGIATSALFLGVTGCADILTYSEDAQKDGVKLYQRGDYANAAGAFRNSVRQNPRNYQGYYYLGMSAFQIGQYQESLAAFRSARETIELTLEGRYDKDFHERILNGIAQAVAKCDRNDAETQAVTAEARKFSTAESYYLLGKIYALKNDPDSAIDAYNKAALLEPNNYALVKEYGLYLERVGAKQRAEAPLRRAYALNQKDNDVNEALRRVGVVPGPSLLDVDKMAKPIIPEGPLPPLRMPSFTGAGRTPGNSSTPTAGAAAPND